MSQFEFKIALNGQIYDSEGLLYAYPEKVAQLRASGQYPAWVNALPFDSRFLRELVVPGGECFSIRYGKEGLYYLYTRYNPHDSRNGAVFVALYTQNYAVSDARQLIITLRNLMDYFLEKQSPISIIDADIAEISKELSNPYIINPPTQQPETFRNDVYRVYRNEEELQRYLNWVVQKEYVDYKWVHFISSEYKKETINPSLYTEMTSRVSDCYVIKHQNANDELVLSGTSYSLVYEKANYLSYSVNVTIGQPSKYVEVVEDHVIRFKTASELNIKFKKRVIINLFDDDTKEPIKDEQGNSLKLTQEIEEGADKLVAVGASGYVSSNVSVNTNKINGSKESINKYLKKEKINNTPSYKNDYDFDNNSDAGDIYRKRKIFQIISACGVVAVAVLLGGFIGFFIQRPTKTDDIKAHIAEKDSIIKVREDSISSLNRTLKIKGDTITNLQKQIKEKETKIQELENKRGLATTPSTPSGPSKKDLLDQAKKGAERYLEKNDSWSLYGMKVDKDIPDAAKQYIEQTLAYKWLNLVVSNEDLTKDDIEKILKPESGFVCNNEKWKTIQVRIQNKKDLANTSRKEKDFIKAVNRAIKNSITTTTNDQHYTDGTISLITLSSNI